jgi:hypothetical protein
MEGGTETTPVVQQLECSMALSADFRGRTFRRDVLDAKARALSETCPVTEKAVLVELRQHLDMLIWSARMLAVIVACVPLGHARPILILLAACLSGVGLTARASPMLRTHAPRSEAKPPMQMVQYVRPLYTLLESVRQTLDAVLPPANAQLASPRAAGCVGNVSGKLHAADPLLTSSTNNQPGAGRSADGKLQAQNAALEWSQAHTLRFIASTSWPRALKLLACVLEAATWPWGQSGSLGVPSPTPLRLVVECSRATLLALHTGSYQDASAWGYRAVRACLLMMPHFVIRLVLPVILLLYALPAPHKVEDASMCALYVAASECAANVHAYCIAAITRSGDDLWEFATPCPSYDTPEYYVRAILGTADLAADSWTEWLYAGYNYAVERRMFPDASLWTCRHLRPRLLDVCAQHGVPFVVDSPWRRVTKLWTHVASNGRRPKADSATFMTETPTLV